MKTKMVCSILNVPISIASSGDYRGVVRRGVAMTALGAELLELAAELKITPEELRQTALFVGTLPDGSRPRPTLERVRALRREARTARLERDEIVAMATTTGIDADLVRAWAHETVAAPAELDAEARARIEAAAPTVARLLVLRRERAHAIPTWDDRERAGDTWGG